MGVIYMKEKMVRLSQLNLSGLLESSIKSVENVYKIVRKIALEMN